MKSFILFLISLPLIVFATAFVWIYNQAGRSAGASLTLEFPSLEGPPQAEDSQVQIGYKVFTEKGCVYCHGSSGKGGVKNLNAQGGEAPKLERIAEGYTYEEFKEKVQKGVPESEKEDSQKPAPPLYMPSWRDHLKEEEIQALYAYFKFLLPKESKEEW